MLCCLATSDVLEYSSLWYRGVTKGKGRSSAYGHDSTAVLGCWLLFKSEALCSGFPPYQGISNAPLTSTLQPRCGPVESAHERLRLSIRPWR
eukprot:2976706-Amphidinium_carterae.1